MPCHTMPCQCRAKKNVFFVVGCCNPQVVYVHPVNIPHCNPHIKYTHIRSYSQPSIHPFNQTQLMHTFKMKNQINVTHKTKITLIENQQ